MTGRHIANALHAVIASTVAGAICVAPAPAQEKVASARVVPIQVTGDAAARFSMVVLGDGYTAEEQPKFRSHLDRHLNVLWSIEPFRSYRNYINVYAVEIVSSESGITCDPAVRQQKATPLKMHFQGGCTNPNARAILVDGDVARSYAALATPHHDQILVLANTDTYGGIGGAIATTSGGNSLGPLITPHELGHSLGGLQDEYTYSARGKPGGPYTGREPASIHLTLLTEDQMRRQRRKWWRWLGNVSEAGGLVGRFEGGASRTSGIWRPSKHSMMISLGYYFDQVSRERITQRISEQVALIAASTPSDRPVGARDVIWIETAHPVYHELQVAWSIDGVLVPAATNSRYLALGRPGMPTASKVTVTVVDPTAFVRDPEIRANGLTATRSWIVSDAARASVVAATLTGSTDAARPVGGQEVVYVVTTHTPDRVPDVTWRVNGASVTQARNRRTLPLQALDLPAGTHTLTVTVADPERPDAPPETRTWTVDNSGPAVQYELSPAIASVRVEEGSRHYFMRDEFTMQLDAADDQPGYVVAEFRVNGDGWHHYYGWPDAPAGTPFRFTPRGTTIKELVYGSLGAEGLSPQPWEPREPGWGTHRIEYRGIDAAGNIGDARMFRVTLQPSPSCTRTIAAAHPGDLRIDAGVVCVTAATIAGDVSVAPGAAFVAENARITGTLRSSGASVLELINTTVHGLRIRQSSGRVSIFGSTVNGAATIAGDSAAAPVLLAANRFRGEISCTGSRARFENGGSANTFEAAVTGECP